MGRDRCTRRLRSDLLALALASVAALLGVIGTGGAAAVDSTTGMRGMWISSVQHTDWPAEGEDSAHEQREHYRRLLNQAEEAGLNAVFVQVRPTADAFWPSPHEPWSKWLTGEQGRYPGYDPLQFLVEETHRRGMQFHAWFNPFRVSTEDDRSALVPEHPARQHPEWTFSYGGELYYDPGVPQVREFVTEAIGHAVDRYDVDGVHLDDYFYPYPAGDAELPDQDTFAEHGGAFESIEQWRRWNVDEFVSGLDARVHRSDPQVRFGISPFGIWRNAGSDPEGSPTSGMESYSAQFADTRKWVRRGWVDYIAPQLYWPLGREDADYAALVPWWSKTTSGTDVDLYIGQAAYKVGQQGWTDPGELSAHLALNREHPAVDGDIYFSATSLNTNARGAFEQLVAEHYS